MSTLATVSGNHPARALALVAMLAGILPATPAPASPPELLTNARIETASGADLAKALQNVPRTGDPQWVGWIAPMAAEQGQVCCFHKGRSSGCKLESHGSGFSMNFGNPGRLPAEELLVLVRFEAGRPTDVRSLDSGCPLDGGGARVLWLDGVERAASVRYLERIANDGPGRSKDIGGEAMASLALHAGAEADAALAKMAGPPTPAEVREDAIFWLGNARGRFGYEVLSRLVRVESDPDLLEKVAFALSQSPVPEAQGTLTEMAQAQPHPDVRSQALFWLAQRGGPGVPEIILRAVEHDRSAEVREQAVFALSQLEDGEGVEHLLRLCKSGPMPARKHALFWLGQSDDPRALAVLEELLLRR